MTSHFHPFYKLLSSLLFDTLWSSTQSIPICSEINCNNFFQVLMEILFLTKFCSPTLSLMLIYISNESNEDTCCERAHLVTNPNKMITRLCSFRQHGFTSLAHFLFSIFPGNSQMFNLDIFL